MMAAILHRRTVVLAKRMITSNTVASNPPQSPSTAATKNNNSPQSVGGDENSDDEPSPWRNSRAKQRIISSLKDSTSEIHFLELQQIHLKFAPRYLFKRFKSNYKRLLAQFEGKTGVFA